MPATCTSDTGASSDLAWHEADLGSADGLQLDVQALHLEPLLQDLRLELFGPPLLRLQPRLQRVPRFKTALARDSN
eukprot:CAMPEP_0177549736 /NCGR_PEP_ID=MMETSP0369-20130122/65191_1 /TAXON_ID=447022 ORGANISM="Scrippsiella hangoei-like, Strain SHHI-4" /NCGR_SAMPLE_ID=MMETSP0369 /ASSEMBLY_ACC=CAM_ASM_000364 /LENGTH=75 /DNA_ID=CAMNT_0019034877 /DNA_START=16 /DNA_END=240 /DNA_ORIENTATION=+